MCNVLSTIVEKYHDVITNFDEISRFRYDTLDMTFYYKEFLSAQNTVNVIARSFAETSWQSVDDLIKSV